MKYNGIEHNEMEWNEIKSTFYCLGILRRNGKHF